MRREGLSLLKLRHRINAHSRSIKVGFPLSVLNSNQLIHLYSEHGLIRDAQKLFDEMPERNLFSWNTIISAQVKSRNLVQARALFDSAPHRDSVTYNSLLSGYVRAGGEFERLAFELFVDMWSHRADEMRIDEVTLTIMVNLCAKSVMLCFATQLHGHMVKTGNDLTGFAVSSLIGMYSKCGCFREACSAFESCKSADVDSVTKNSLLAACCRAGEMDMAASVFEMATELNDTISWNTLIWGYVQYGCVDEIFDLFLRMRENGVQHDVHTFASLLIACSRLKSLNLGKEVHAYVVKNGFLTNPFIRDGIVDVYCKCGNMSYAELLHFSTTASPFSVTSMVAGYSSQGNMEEARKMFDSLIEKNAIAWTSLFSGYVKTQQCEAVFDLLSQFRAKEEGKMSKSPNCFILVSVLGACALQASLLSGKQVHGFALRTTIEMDEKMISATVDMYIKCGCLSYAEKIFKRVLENDIVLYNVMLAGYAHHGDADKAIGLFRDMTKKGIPPDGITFVAILSACRHCGLVELGERFFDSMEVVYGVVPESDHYACMIDLYLRANRLEDAETFFIERIPEEERKCGVIVGAFLNACKNAELARKVEAAMLGGGGGGRYVQLANVYAAEGKWIEMQRVRKMMRGKERKKFAGCSWVYVDDRPQIFTSGDATHPRSRCVYEILHSLTAELGRKL